jgi:glycosyltransferase involved in cell wall biosynthesis
MPSVKMRGRVSQVELAKEMLSAGVLAYPGGFCETSCISAAEAQAAGCHVVASALAALNETVGPRGRLVSNGIVQQSRIPPDQPESYKAEFAAAIVEAIGKARNGPNVEGMTWARTEFGLDTLASDWDVMIRELVAEMDVAVVPKFRGAA